jgi:hypothetical protein
VPSRGSALHVPKSVAVTMRTSQPVRAEPTVLPVRPASPAAADEPAPEKKEEADALSDALIKARGRAKRRTGGE